MARTEGEPTGIIVVGIDGSDSSIAAARWACRQARIDGSAIELVTVWQWPISWGPAMPLPDDYDPGADMQAMLDDIAGALTREFPDVRLHARYGQGPSGSGAGRSVTARGSAGGQQPRPR